MAYYTERIDLLQQMFLPIQGVFNQNYLENILNSLQNLRNQLINAIDYTEENNIATVQTIQIIKTGGRPRYEISFNNFTCWTSFYLDTNCKSSWNFYLNIK